MLVDALTTRSSPGRSAFHVAHTRLKIRRLTIPELTQPRRVSAISVRYVVRAKYPRLEERAVMAVKAWLMDESNEDPRLPHQRNPVEFVSLERLSEIGVLYWHLKPEDYENDEELKKIREERGYNYMDMLDLCPQNVQNYEEKLKNYYTEHIHADEEIRYCLEGSAYFDVRDKDDNWIRILIKAGDLIILPAGIYHRFTLDTNNYVKLMRLFQGEPVWTAYNRPQEDHPARKEYVKGLTERVVLEAH